MLVPHHPNDQVLARQWWEIRDERMRFHDLSQIHRHWIGQRGRIRLHVQHLAGQHALDLFWMLDQSGTSISFQHDQFAAAGPIAFKNHRRPGDSHGNCTGSDGRAA